MAQALSTSTMSGPRAIIDSSALRHNLSVVRKQAPRSKVMAVIKANAYGHGIVPSARALIGADAFGVARLSEALALRENGLGQPIVLLEGVFSLEELNAAATHSLEIVVHSFEQLALLRSWHGTRQLHAWLKVDTGMNRLGFRLSDFPSAWQQLHACTSIAAMPRLMTHLACADERANAVTQGQLAKFHAVADTLRLERSAANSAGLLAWPDARMEWVRPGLMLYGISPFADALAKDFALRPAMTLLTPLIAIRNVEAAESVGYGGTWTATHASRIGIAAIGYGDGYPRQIGSGSPVLVNNIECSIAGRVSMDMIAVDLANVPSPKVGDEVTLWGEGMPVERMAACAGTIPYELVCGISQRVTVDYR
jgi:alanine racemase